VTVLNVSAGPDMVMPVHQGGKLVGNARVPTVVIEYESLCK
jgi:hypothetical protein